MKIQALFRGAYVRKKIIPSLKNFHRGAKAVVDSIVEEALEVGAHTSLDENNPWYNRGNHKSQPSVLKFRAVFGW